MAWPIPPLSTAIGNATPQLDTHPNHHNALADAVNELAARGGFPVEGQYTPTLSAITLGTGATNDARFVFVGGPDVGDVGLMFAWGNIVLGTGGALTGAPLWTLPPGFNVASQPSGASTDNVGHAYVVDDSAGGIAYQSQCIRNGVTQYGLRYYLVVGTLIERRIPSATAPMTWAANDIIRWNATHPAVRV